MPLSQSQTRPLNNIDGTASSIQNDIYLSRIENNHNNHDSHNNHINHNHFPPLKNGEGEELPVLLPTSLSVIPPPSLPAVPLNIEPSKPQTPVKNCPAKPKPVFATPDQVIKLYMSKLTPYEQREIFNYSHIYFIGANAKKRPGIVGSPNNCGYDNEQGSYIHVPHDHIAYRFEVLKVSLTVDMSEDAKCFDINYRVIL